MARVRTRMPRVFVGHPFGHHFSQAKFRRLFHELPFDSDFGNSDLQTGYLLTGIKDKIKQSDYALFDLTDWNPNVALELGLAEGLSKKSARGYYILQNKHKKRAVLSDIQGIQRLEYASLDYKKGSGLGDLLINSILMKEPRIKKIHDALVGSPHPEMQIRLALKILAFFREDEKLTPEKLASLKRGTNLH